MANEKQIDILKSMAKAWFGNSQQHSIHAEIIRQKGYAKLADKMQAEADDEWKEAQRVNARLLELGGTPVVAIDEFPYCTIFVPCWNTITMKASKAWRNLMRFWRSSATITSPAA